MGGLADEYESFLDEGWNSVVGGEEEEADGEDEETETVCDSLHAFSWMGEHGGHHHPHHCEHYQSRKKQFGCTPDVYEVAAHENPGFRQERIGKFWCKLFVLVGALSNFWCEIVVFIHRVVAAMRRGSARKNLT